MKKFVIGLLMFMVFAVTVPVSVEACTRHRKARRSTAARSYARTNRRYAAQSYTAQRPSFYRRHRNLINVGLASGGGALVGGLLGGNRRGMGYGALVGAGAGALYTYVLKPKKRRY